MMGRPRDQIPKHSETFRLDDEASVAITSIQAATADWEAPLRSRSEVVVFAIKFIKLNLAEISRGAQDVE